MRLATAPVKADVRVIAATHRGLAGLMEEGEFRQDLFFRLNVLRLTLPPLAERREDIPLLAEHFLERLGRKAGRPGPRLSQDALELLLRYDYPGNVRELENIVEHAFVLCRAAEIRRGDLPREFLEAAERAAPPSAGRGGIRDGEVRLIREALARHRGHRGKTAAELGIDKSTLWRKMKRHRITFP